jgi:hypothetical protein
VMNAVLFDFYHFKVGHCQSVSHPVLEPTGTRSSFPWLWLGFVCRSPLTRSASCTQPLLAAKGPSGSARGIRPGDEVCAEPAQCCAWNKGHFLAGTCLQGVPSARLYHPDSSSLPKVLNTKTGRL